MDRTAEGDAGAILGTHGGPSHTCRPAASLSAIECEGICTVRQKKTQRRRTINKRRGDRLQVTIARLHLSVLPKMPFCTLPCPP